MYEFLKMLLPVAEDICNIRDITMHENDPYTGKQIKIEGVDNENRSVELRLTIKDNETGAEE